MGRLLLIIFILLIANVTWFAIAPEVKQVHDDGFEKTVSKEKTINTVQTHRKERRLQAEKATELY